jgi:hypothetical protein
LFTEHKLVLTVYQNDTATSLSDLRPGDAVRIEGTMNSDGEWTVSMVGQDMATLERPL